MKSRMWMVFVPLLFTLAACSDQPPAAAESPALEIAAPASGSSAQIGQVLQVLVMAAPNLELSTVVVTCDGRGIGTVQSAPYAVQWRTAEEQPGEHVLRATAYTRSGEKVSAEPVTVSLLRPEAQIAGPAPTGTGATGAIAPATLKEGTPVLLQTTEKMISGRVAEGSNVRFRVARDILGPNGSVLIAYGSFAQGKVTRSRRRGMFGKAGQLEFTVETVDAVDGTVVPLRAQQEMAGKDNKTTVIATALLLTVFTVFVNGKDIEVPADTELTAYLDHDTVIQQPRPAGQGPATSAAPQPSAGSGAGSVVPAETVTIRAPSDGSEVKIGTDVNVAVNASPEQKLRLIALLCDGKRVAHHEGELVPLLWPTRGMPPGEHVLEVDVQFASQRWVRSAPVRVTLIAE